MFHYFGYGSNLDLTALQAKGVKPLASEIGTLRGWRIRFNVRHWFRHEGGVGNIEQTGDPSDRVLGLVHRCEDDALPRLDALEAFGVGYDRIEVPVETQNGTIPSVAYVGLPAYLDEARLPTRRYLNIILRGATTAGLEKSYIDALDRHPLHPAWDYPEFVHPTGDFPIFDAASLAEHPRHTAVAGAVFDMADARSDLHCLWNLFGGKDTTLFHLHRLDTSDGSETLADIAAERVSDYGRSYLNAYLHEYAAEYRYAGRYRF